MNNKEKSVLTFPDSIEDLEETPINEIIKLTSQFVETTREIKEIKRVSDILTHLEELPDFEITQKLIDKLWSMDATLEDIEGLPVKEVKVVLGLYENQRTRRPKDATLHRSKLVKMVFNIEGEELVPNIATEVTGMGTHVKISYDALENDILFSTPMTPTAMQVHDAVSGLILEDNRSLTIDMIYRQMTGNPKARASKKRKEEIEQELHRGKKADITILKGNEKKKRGREGTPKGGMEGQIYYYIREWEMINNQLVNTYHFRDIPILLIYALNHNQITRVPLEILNPPIRKNEAVMALISYMAVQIKWMEDEGRSNIMLLDTIYKDSGYFEVNQPHNTQLARCREALTVILDYFIKTGFIKDYTFRDSKNRPIPEGKKGTVDYHSILIEN